MPVQWLSRLQHATKDYVRDVSCPILVVHSRDDEIIPYHHGREIFETEIWLPWLLQRTKLQVVEECQEHEILSGAFNTIDEVMDQNPQFEARNYWQTIQHPEAGEFRYPGAPSFTTEGWWKVRTPAPLLGEHTKSVLTGSLGYSDTSILELLSSGIVS